MVLAASGAMFYAPSMSAQTSRTKFKSLPSMILAMPRINAHLLQFDTVHGRFNQQVEVGENSISINGDEDQMVLRARPGQYLPGADLGVDLVCECTGVFTSRDKAALHLAGGAKKVLISAPGSNVDATVVYGINDHMLTRHTRIISNASCTTNCLAPMVKPLHEAMGILSRLHDNSARLYQ